MDYTVQEMMEFIEENDVKFVRLAFCDVFGVQKNISIASAMLPRAFETGISFDASAVRGFMRVEESDLFLFPDLSTAAILPWRPQQGRVLRFYCDIRHPDGRPFAGDGRQLLKNAVLQMAQEGYQCKVGAECEFYLFERDQFGNPTNVPQDTAGYLDMAPADRGENIRREICLTLEEMGIVPETSHHEQGPGQNEIDFRYAAPLRAADDLTTLKAVVQVLADQSGLCASFLPKPLKGCPGSGLHTNLSIYKDGKNLFAGEGPSEAAGQFIAGILNRVRDITLFLNPQVQSYQRLGRMEAPGFVTWSHQNRSQLVRIPAATGDFARMELRSPDPSCNPYIAFALLLLAGLEGLKKGEVLPEAADFDLYSADEKLLAALPRLPRTLAEAVDAAQSSAFVQRALPEKMIAEWAGAARDEWAAYRPGDDDIY